LCGDARDDAAGEAVADENGGLVQAVEHFDDRADIVVVGDVAALAVDGMTGEGRRLDSSSRLAEMLRHN
jgi:hypothetical protein